MVGRRDASFDIGERFGTIGFVFERDHAAPDRCRDHDLPRRALPGREPPPGGHLRHVADRRPQPPRFHDQRDRAIDLETGELIDPFDGQARSRTRRGSGPSAMPRSRFHEDPLRLLRAARFVGAARLLHRARDQGGDDRAGAGAAPDQPGADLRRADPAALRRRSPRTVWRCCSTPGSVQVAMPELKPLARRGARSSGRIHREKDLWEHTLRVVDKSPARPIVRWAALLHDAAKPHTRSVSRTGRSTSSGTSGSGADLAATLLRRLGADKQTDRRRSRGWSSCTCARPRTTSTGPTARSAG